MITNEIHVFMCKTPIERFHKFQRFWNLAVRIFENDLQNWRYRHTDYYYRYSSIHFSWRLDLNTAFFGFLWIVDTTHTHTHNSIYSPVIERRYINDSILVRIPIILLQRSSVEDTKENGRKWDQKVLWGENHFDLYVRSSGRLIQDKIDVHDHDHDDDVRKLEEKKMPHTKVNGMFGPCVCVCFLQWSGWYRNRKKGSSQGIKYVGTSRVYNSGEQRSQKPPMIGRFDGNGSFLP